jgi:hypothetical protein
MLLWRTTLRAVTLGILMCLGTNELRGNESEGAHVLFSFDHKDAAAAQASSPLGGTVPQVPGAPHGQSPAKIDSQVLKASLEENTPSEPVSSDRRRLAPLSRNKILAGTPTKTERSKLPFEIPHVESLGTAGAGLVLVVGLFLLCVSLMRRGGPSPTSPLPQDAVAVLGRIPLTPKQFAHLIQVGNNR